MADQVLSAIQQNSPSRARTAKIVMSGVMRLAARHAAVPANPIREVGSIESKPKRRPRAMTAAERTQWLAAVEKHGRAKLWDLPGLSRMMLATGYRIGECLAIGWDGVDLDQATVDIRWHLVRYTGIGLVRSPSIKSGCGG